MRYARWKHLWRLFRWAIIALIFLTACARQPSDAPESTRGGGAASVPVTVATVVAKAVPVQVWAIGTVEAYASVTVRPQVSGQLAHIHFAAGQEVTQGDILLTIDPRPFEARLRQAEATLARDLAQLEWAREEAARYAQLVRRDFVSREDYEQRRAQAAALEATVRADRAAVGQILAGPLARLDIQDAMIEKGGVAKGTLTVAQHFGLSPQWLDPQEQIAALTQQHYEYIVHDALIKTMPQGLFTYSLAEHAEVSADFSKAAFRLRQGLKFHDGSPLTTADVQWSYEHYRGVNATAFKEHTERIEVVDDRTIVFHFNKPFLDFLTLYNGDSTGAGWVVPKAYYQKVGPDGFKAHPIGAGPFTFVSQKVGVEMVFEAWDEYWRKVPGVKKLVVKGIGGQGGAATRLAGLKTGELDLAYGFTGKILPQVLKDPALRWDPNFTAPWVLFFPNWEDPQSPFHDKRVRQAVSLGINRELLIQQETQGLGVPWGNWIGAEFDDILQLPVPEYDPEKARQLLAEAGYPQGLKIDALIPFTPYFDMGERLLADLRAVGIKGSLQTYDGPQYRGKRSQGRKGYESKATILKSIAMSPGAAAFTIRLYGTCKSSASFICDDRIEAVWTRYNASTDPEERKRLSQKMQRITIEEFLAIPLYINPFVHALGPKVLPAGTAAQGEGYHKYWATPQAPYPYPWEEWKVKAE